MPMILLKVMVRVQGRMTVGVDGASSGAGWGEGLSMGGCMAEM